MNEYVLRNLRFQHLNKSKNIFLSRPINTIAILYHKKDASAKAVSTKNRIKYCILSIPIFIFMLKYKHNWNNSPWSVITLHPSWIKNIPPFQIASPRGNFNMRYTPWDIFHKSLKPLRAGNKKIYIFICKKIYILLIVVNGNLKYTF